MPRPKSTEETNTLLSVNEMEILLAQKRKVARRRIFGIDADVQQNGFLSTANGEVLTSVGAMNLAREKAKKDKAR